MKNQPKFVVPQAKSGKTLPMRSKSVRHLALAALFGGAAGIGFAPIFVRLSPVGPSATAFYRLLFALPLLWAGAWLEAARAETTWNRDAEAGAGWRSPFAICSLAGFLFAADLAFWHCSVKLTSVANSTLLTNCAPFFVMLGARLLFAERITMYLIAGLLVASFGACLLVGVSLQLTSRQ
jgi:drug/metabolite transporter (DMT)-like permease